MDDLKIDWSNKDDTNGITIPSCYPNARYQDTLAARPDDENVEASKEWVEEKRL